MGSLTIDDTHGILRQPGVEVFGDSRALRWQSAFASFQREQPYEQTFRAAPSHMIILHLDSLVRVERWLDGRHEEQRIGPGGLFYMPGGHDFRVHLGGRLSTVHLYLPDALVRSVAEDIDVPSAEIRPCFGGGDPLIERLLLSIRDELLDPGLLGDGYIDTLSRAAAARLLRRSHPFARRSAATSPRAAEAGQRLRRAVDFLEANLHRSVELEELARHLDLGVSRLVTLFKAHLGMSPHRFIIARRVARAREMLAAGRAPLVEVALACGFAHQEHMTRIFRREVGVTPGEYRRSFF